MRYFLELAYNGKNYFGWQIQPDVISVQEKINTALSTILQEKIAVVGAGRTDTGVHASQMYAHFDVEKELDANFTYRLNSILPKDIVIYKIILVADEAHARFDAIQRSYEYKIWIGRNPFLLDSSWQFNFKNIDVVSMNKAAKILFEYENFECFSKVKTEVHTFNCEIKNAKWILNGNELTFYITANRFLRNMVRAIVGTLLNVGLQKITIEEFRAVIESRNRSKAGTSVPAKGLFLTEVAYDYI